MKRNIIYWTIAAALLILSGCKKFLEVQPQDKYVGDQVFSNQNAIQQSLNGLYANLASNNLYGANLSTVAIELMAQRYNMASYNVSTGLKLFQQYSYTDPTTQLILESIWTSAYANILQANQFIEQIDVAAQKGIIPTPKATQLKGEAIGIRALLHFDMLRLFGPVFKTSPDSAAIPYYTKADATSQPILTATQALDSVLADLNTAKTLLAADPVITSGPNITSTDFYSGSRNQRLNYYAVIALQARAYLYGGDAANANATAKQALAAFDTWFPWLPYTSIVANVNPDRIFSTEVVFGVYNQNMYINYQTYFSPTLTSAQVLTAFPSRLTGIFENNQNDYRYLTTWIAGANGSTFYKYADLTDVSRPWRFLQPMIRKSELYYILAETEPADGITYLNTVRNNRGLVNLTGTAVLTTEIQKEYQKEFWGEGQLFYYYKRNALTAIPSGLNGTGTVAPVYVVPLPLSETTPR
jgi:hypothetical protein